MAYETYGTKLSVTAIAVILQGQELSLNYLEPYLPRQERQAQLASRYKFDCVCEACLPEARDVVRAFVCRKCDSGIVCPVGNGLEASNWSCGKCSRGISSERFKKLMELETTMKSKDSSDVPVNDLIEGGARNMSLPIFHI